jgi:glycerol-3-phosphate O-acyltransferase
MMLRAFLESYLIVADELASRRDEAIGPEAPFLARCEARGACYSKDRVIRSPEAVSRHLFATGLKLAVNRGLGERRDDLAARRAAFAAELRDVLGRMATVRQVAVRRVQALVGGQAGASGPSV